MIVQFSTARSLRGRVCVAARLLLIVALAVSATACSTIDYRGVQADFNHAVSVDNSVTVTGHPFTDPGYADIVGHLTDERIAALDPRLRANAWLLLSFSQYRLDELGTNTGAMRSQSRGIAAEPTAGSRDDVLLKLIPALVVDRELEIEWVAMKRTLTPAQYDPTENGGSAESSVNFERDFKSAIETVDLAMQATGPTTPPSVNSYLHYQRWRVLANWRSVILSIHDVNGSDDEARNEELNDAKVFLGGTSLGDSVRAERDQLPKHHTLRALIRAQGGG